MAYSTVLTSPLGPLSLCCDDTGLTHLAFGSRLLPGTPVPEEEPPILRQTAHWLEAYWLGRDPGPLPPLHPEGTPFQQRVWALLCSVPYGQTTTYGALARQIAAQTGRPRMSAQAVGGAVGRNPIAILVPCHRVLGADGSLTGYAYGLECKQRLLALEGILLRESKTK
ncbi:MAG: methylated-DNA--[protein]-cysteine S-methyltransferase [Faecalibacterium sp.]